MVLPGVGHFFHGALHTLQEHAGRFLALKAPISKKPGKPVVFRASDGLVAEWRRLSVHEGLEVLQRQRAHLLAGRLGLEHDLFARERVVPLRALVAGFFTTLSFSRPGSVTMPWPRRLFLMTPCRESKTALTCLRESSVSLEMVARISDLVGAPPFFAMCGYSRELMFVQRGISPPSDVRAKHSTCA